MSWRTDAGEYRHVMVWDAVQSSVMSKTLGTEGCAISCTGHVGSRSRVPGDQWMSSRPIAIGRGRGIGRCIDRTIVSLAFLWLGEITDQLMVCSAWASVSKPSPFGAPDSKSFVAIPRWAPLVEPPSYHLS